MQVEKTDITPDLQVIRNTFQVTEAPGFLMDAQTSLLHMQCSTTDSPCAKIRAQGAGSLCNNYSWPFETTGKDFLQLLWLLLM